MAIITRAYGRKLVKAGKAREVGLTSGGDRWPDYPHYVIIERLDTQTTDHYPAD